MSKNLNETDMATLQTRLGVPVAVDDCLQDPSIWNGDLQYALHSVLSDMQPDTALLSIALSAGIIAEHAMQNSASMAGLKLKTDMIIGYYAPDWLAHAIGSSLKDDRDIATLLEAIPEDLEDIADLIGVALADFSADAPHMRDMLEVLMIQADAHKLIAQTVLEQKQALDPSGIAVFPPVNDNGLSGPKAV